MFMKLEDAQKLDPNITQADVDTLEQIVRGITNNHFHVPVTRRSFVGDRLGAHFEKSSIVLPASADGKPLQGTRDFIQYLHKGDTIEVSGTGANDGVFIIEDIVPHNDKDEIDLDFAYNITVLMPSNMPEWTLQGTTTASLVKVFYPLDVIGGVKKLIEYDVNMSGRTGVKQETVSRLSVTYFDMTAAESEGGYPRSLMSFLVRHRQFNWE